MTIRYRPQVVHDLYGIVDTIAEHRPRSAEQFTLQFEDTCRLLERFPLLGAVAPVDELAALGLRMYSVRRFVVYVLLYLPLSDGIEVVRVVDGRQDLVALFDGFG